MTLNQGNMALAYRSLKAAKGRSFLTMLGIIIGVMAVVLVVCIGQGIKEQIAGQLGRYGKNTLTVQPGSHDTSAGLLSGLSGTTGNLLSENDLRIVQKADAIEYAVPISTTTGSMRGDHTVNSPFIVATTADFPNVVDQSIEYGGFFDADLATKTVVLGENIAHKLFNDNSPLGQTLIWRGQHFVVAGVFGNFSAPPFSIEANFNNAVFVPYSTAQDLSGSVLGIYQILAKAKSGSDLQQTAHSIDASLAASHGGSKDVTVLRADDTDTGSNKTIHLLTVLVSGAAIIALIVGGVGIMDVMLVSVTERMHEIGVRKAIGATNRQIMRQFMAEAFVLSGVGALIGVILSCAVVGLLRFYSSLEPVLVWQVLVVAPLVAITVGLFFGSMPALKAARKDPIEALRHE
jgi:putative ABC transport system permease protein